ncbi:MAG: tetratricopeptide repeat protein, partial [Phaeodactylibacter sp.]|nr:tetratricopeptide repeat protein [Phaeodactylibacter sp.]
LLGYVKGKQEKFLQALEAYENAQKHYTALDFYPENYLYSMNRAAQACLRTLEYDRALRFLRAVEAKDTKGQYRERVYYTYLLAHFYLGNMEKAQAYSDALLALPNLRDKRIAQVYNKTKDLHLHFGEYNQAIEADNWLIQYYLSDNDTAATAFPLSNLAQVALAQGEQAQAIQYYKEALQVYQPYLELKNRENAKFLANAGQFFEGLGDRARALELYQQALQQVFTNFTDDSIYASPSLDEVGTESWMMSTTRFKGQALYQQYLLTKDLKDLEAAGTSFRLFRQATENLRQTYGSDQSKIYLGQYLKADTDAAMQVFLELYQMFGREDYIPDIYALMERSKAVALSDAIIEHKAFAFADIPDSLLQVEKNLRQEIAELRNTFLTAASNERTTLQQQLDSLQQDYRFLTEDIENQFPKFKNFQTGNALLPLETIQAYLKKHQGHLIEYYWGAEQVVALLINGERTLAIELPATESLEPL